MTTKAESLALVEREWAALDALFAATDERALARPIFAGEGDGWTVRDMPTHFAYWWRMAARGARHAAKTNTAPGQTMPLRTFLDIAALPDDLNAENFASWRARPTAQLFAEMRAAHDELRAALADLPPELMLFPDATTDGMRRYLWQPAVNHIRQHRPHLESALKVGART